MKTFIVISILILSLSSCRRDPVLPVHEIGYDTLDFVRFKMVVPANWIWVKKQGFDSYVGQIKIDEEENVNFDLGWYSNSLNVDSATHDITMTTIDDKIAKIVQPKNYGLGTTGVYFESVDTSGLSKFQISGIDLNEEHQKQFLIAIETLDFIP